MSTNKEKDVYLKDGKLDLSLLDEEMLKPVNKAGEYEEYNSILEDLESMDLKNIDISATLEEMAMIFEEDEYNMAFNKQRLDEDMRDFSKKD